MLARGSQMLPPLTAEERREERVARGLLFLLRREAEWVHRRVERFSFVDDRSSRRQMSVDFTLPVSSRRVKAYFAEVGCVPLLLLRKQTLRRFSIWDEEGRAVPLLTAAQASPVSGSMLAGVARRIARDAYGEALHEDAARALRAVPRLPSRSANLLLDCMELDPWDQAELLRSLWWPDPRVVELLDPLPRHAELLRAVLADPGLAAPARELASQFTMLVPVESNGPARRVLKFAYDEALAPPPHGGVRRRVARSLASLGLATTDYEFSGVFAGHAQSHHVEIEAPADVEIVRANLRATLPSRRVISNEARNEREVAHLHLDDVPRGARAVSNVSLRARRPGLVRTGPLLAAAVTVMLFVGKGRVSTISAEAGNALLLAVPALLAVVITRPGEHPLTTRMLLGVRLIVWTVGLCSAVAATALALGVKDHHLHVVWEWPTYVALAATVLLSLSAVLPRPAPRSSAS